MSWHKRLAAFLIPLLLVSAFVAFFHHHENTADDHDCPICIASHHAPATGASAAAFDGKPCFVETIVVAPAPLVSDSTFVSLLNNRAPPA